MPSPPRAALLLAMGVLSLWAACEAVPQVTSVNQLRDYMYREMKYSRACYKLLNATGAVGCEESTGLGSEAPLMHYEDLPAVLTGGRIQNELRAAARALAGA